MTDREPVRPIDAIPASTPETEHPALPPDARRSTLSRAIVTSAAIAAMLAFAAPLFFTADGWLVLPPLAALAGALALDGFIAPARCRRRPECSRGPLSLRWYPGWRGDSRPSGCLGPL